MVALAAATAGRTPARHRTSRTRYRTEQDRTDEGRGPRGDRQGRHCGPSRQGGIMRNIIGLGTVLGTCIACTTPVASQSMAEDPLNDTALTCRTVVGEAEIDGAMQQIMGRACRQPDGTWQIVQGADGSEAAIYPVPAYPYYPYYPYYDPWYWGPPVTIG